MFPLPRVWPYQAKQAGSARLHCPPQWEVGVAGLNLTAGPLADQSAHLLAGITLPVCGGPLLFSRTKRVLCSDCAVSVWRTLCGSKKHGKCSSTGGKGLGPHRAAPGPVPGCWLGRSHCQLGARCEATGVLSVDMCLF